MNCNKLLEQAEHSRIQAESNKSTFHNRLCPVGAWNSAAGSWVIGFFSSLCSFPFYSLTTYFGPALFGCREHKAMQVTVVNSEKSSSVTWLMWLYPGVKVSRACPMTKCLFLVWGFGRIFREPPCLSSATRGHLTVIS